MSTMAKKLRLGTRVMKIALVLSLVLIVAACSTKTKQLFFDIQPPTAKELAEQELKKQAALIEAQSEELQKNHAAGSKGMLFNLPDDKAPRPEIESVMEWDRVKKLLPKDYKKNIDWSAALEQGLIRPRPGEDPRALWATAFQWDFVIKGEEPEDDAFFPHSAHTQWLGCRNCHNPSLYPYKRNPATMKEMKKKGVSCGACHGKKKVSFSLKACDRCHLNSDEDDEEEE
ncbi:MAG: c(7)-type cytochrome triheme domain-containing protein [Candidatus Thiodiazotropha endolucinida]